jgi:hypothetical protein
MGGLMMSAKLRGKGMWIWQVRNCEGGDVGSIVAKAQRAGLTHLLVKLADGVRSYNGDISGLVQAGQAAGLQVWGWQYTYGSSPEAEAQHGAQRARQFGVDGFVIDAEAEYEGQAARATAYVRALRAELDSLPVALSSFYLPNYHADFPWREFLAGCDWNMPQVYWYRRDPVQALEASLAQHERFGKPIFPTGAAYPEAATAEQLERFLAAVREHGLPGVNCWDWQEATGQMWTVLRDLAWPRARLIVARGRADGSFAYQQVHAELRDDGQFWVRPADLAPVVGSLTPRPPLPAGEGEADSTERPVREVMAQLGVDAEYKTQHLADETDPRVYVFVYAKESSPMG